MKKIISFALAVVMVMTLLPMTIVSVFAAETDTTEKNITLGAAALQGAQKSNVYYGNYQQSEYAPTTAPESPEENTVYTDSDGTKFVYQSKKQKYFKIDPIKWRVLSNADGKLFLLADQNLDVFQYNTEYVDVTWEISTMRSWLNGYAASENGQSIDYTSDNFIKTAFSTQELAYILQTTLENANNHEYATTGGNNTEDYVFLLSIAEAQNTAYGFTDNESPTDTRKAVNTAYVYGGGKIGSDGMSEVGIADFWWLRSPGDDDLSAARVEHHGRVSYNGHYVNNAYHAVRPAFNLNLSSVLFTSAAKGGKTVFSANAALTAGDGYKLTLLDTSRSAFSAEIFKTADKTYVKYQGATTGTNEYITAMIVNANGEVTYYGSLNNITEAEDASGTIDIDLSGKLNSGDKVYILNEQWNGDYKTDYASALNEVQISKFVENDTGSVEVTYGVSESYTVTIPADITLSANAETDVEVKTSSVVVEYGKQLTVSVSSSNYSEGKWYLVDSASASNKLEYSIKNGDNPVASDDTILTVAAGTTDEQKVTLKAKLVDAVTYSGTYKDTLTFTVGVASASGGTTETYTTVTDGNGLETALKAGGKIKLGANIELTETLEIQVTSADLDITLDLNGYSIMNAEDFSGGNLLLFGNESSEALNLTIRDSSSGKTGKIENTSENSTTLLFAYAGEEGSSEITLESGVISGEYYALTLNGEAKANINGGTLVGGSDSIKGAALHFSGRYASAVINGGMLYNNGIGYSILLKNADNRLEIKDGEIRTAINVESTDMPTITVTGGKFTFDPSQYVDTEHYDVIESPVSNPTMWMVTAKDD